jgi:uncharacterized repeat protein (TIGR01451 family)
MRMLNAAGTAAALAAFALAGACESMRTDQTTSSASTGSTYQTGRSAQTQAGAQAQNTPARNRVFGTTEASFPTGEGSSSLVQVTTQARSSEARVGQKFPYTLRVANLSRDLTLDNVTVVQELPGSFQLADAGPPPADHQGASGRWNVGQLGPGEAKTIDVSVVPQEPGQFQSCFHVQYEPVLCTTLNVVQPALAIDLQAPERVSLCEGIPVRVRVRNTGSGSTDPVRINLLTPAGPAAPTADQATSFDAGALTAGDTREFTARLKPDKPGRFVTAAVAESPGGMRAQAKEITTDVWAAQLDVKLTGPENAFISDNVPYTLVVSNSGNGPAENASVKLTLDRSARVVQPSTRTESESPTIDLGTINPGEQREVPLLINTRSAGPMHIRADATARCAQSRPADIATSFSAVPALLLEAVDTTDPVRIGQDEVYRITVLNQGTGPDHDIRVSAEVPQSFEFVNATGPTQAKLEDRMIHFDPVADLGPGEKAVWNVTLHAVRPGDIRFHVELLSDSIKEPAVKMEPTRVY